jgi:hypothetical protein
MGVRAGSFVLEDKQQLKDKRKIFVDWKKATGITIPINNSEDAIKYAKMDAGVKDFIKQHSAHYSISFHPGNSRLEDGQMIFPVQIDAIYDGVPEYPYYNLQIRSNGTIVNRYWMMT